MYTWRVESGKSGFCYLCEVERPRKMWVCFTVKIFSLILRVFPPLLTIIVSCPLSILKW